MTSPYLTYGLSNRTSSDAFSLLVHPTLLLTNDTVTTNSTASSLPDDADAYVDFFNRSQFVTGIILYPIITIVGLTGNVLTLIVLSHRKMLTSTNVFLSALAAADIIKLLNDTLYFLVSILLRRHQEAGNRMLGYMYPFSHYIFNQSVCVSSWLTVSVAVERYISVCHATRVRVLCTIFRAKVISVFVFVVMSLVAVPSALRYQRVVEVDPITNKTSFIITPSALGRNEQFMTGYSWVQNLLRSIIPVIVLIILNMWIIHALRRERIPGKKMSARNRITFMLIVVIIVFIICIFPDAIMSTFFRLGYVDENFLVKGIREFTDLLLALNSAVNFMIYCLCSQSFRDVFVEIFFKRCQVRYQMYQQVRPNGAPKGMRSPKRPTATTTTTTGGTTLEVATNFQDLTTAASKESINADVHHQGERTHNGTQSGPGQAIKLDTVSAKTASQPSLKPVVSENYMGADTSTGSCQPLMNGHHVTVYCGPQTYL